MESPLTDKQKQEAINQYIQSRLTEDEVLLKRTREHLEDEKAKINARLEELENQCSHPLIARETENCGNSGNWDNPEGSYWTRHHCLVCDKRWHTNQSWKQVGGKHGHPDDEAARDY